MTIWDYVKNEIGEEEANRIDRYIKHCRELQNKGSIRTDTEEHAMQDVLCILDGMEIQPKTLYVLTVMIALGDYSKRINEEPNWSGISYKLMQEIGVSLQYENGIVHITKCDEYLTFAEMIRLNSITPEASRIINSRTKKPDNWVNDTPANLIAAIG